MQQVGQLQSWLRYQRCLFVDLPTAETQASFWSAVIRGASLLGLGLVAALLAILAVARPITLARPTPA
jgi:hypothetical protein